MLWKLEHLAEEPFGGLRIPHRKQGGYFCNTTHFWQRTGDIIPTLATLYYCRKRFFNYGFETVTRVNNGFNAVITRQYYFYALIL